MAPSNLKYAIGIYLVLVLALGFLAPQEADGFWGTFPIFEAVFGFFGCLVIIFVSKALGHLFLQKKEDYYDD